MSEQNTHPQAQDSLDSQMRRVIARANRHGEYDAADWIRRWFPFRPASGSGGEGEK